MSRRVVTMSVGAVLLLVLGIVGAQLPVPYAALSPGPTLDTLGSVGKQDIISVDGRAPNKTAGHLNLTTVSVTDGLHLFSALRGWLDGDVAVVPRSEIFPPDKTPEQVDQENTQAFTDSENAAVVAALHELKMPDKVVVSSIAGDASPSKGKLKVRDVLVSIDGVPSTNLDALTKLLTGLDPGKTVKVEYERDHKPGSTEVTLTKATNRKGGALGITVDYRPVAPYDIDIKVGEDIGGPSAGLMFALGILEKVGPTELTGGRFIAGTGTIDDDGKVGPIGGIPLKMIAAREAGAVAFLVPADNCQEAQGDHPDGLQLIKVSSLHQALGALQTLRGGGTPEGC
jgi:Lon-like protease